MHYMGTLHKFHIGHAQTSQYKSAIQYAQTYRNEKQQTFVSFKILSQAFS